MGIKLGSLPIETQRQILAMAEPGVAIEQSPKSREAKFVEPGLSIEEGRVVIVIAAETASETNSREWRKRSKRMDASWRRTREAIGPHLGALEPYARAYASGHALRVKFTRLGGRGIDKSNLGGATKGIEDAIAFMLGADDGSPQWHPDWDKEPGGEVGVRVEIEIF